MRHLVVEDWSRGQSPIHVRDARIKLIVLIAILVAAGTSDRLAELPALEILLLAGLWISRIPLKEFILRIFSILPVPAVFAGIVWLSGDGARAVLLLGRSLVSVTAILLAVSTTPLPHILAALVWLRIPPMLVDTLQFVYRYLFVLVGEVLTVRAAAAARAGSGSLIAAASGAGVLFARSYSRAEAIHRSLLARGFSGESHAFHRWCLNRNDILLLACVGVVVTANTLSGWF